MFFGLFWRDFLGLFTTRFGPDPVQVRSLGPVHSPAGPGPIIRVQVHLYLDLDPDIWGLVRSGPGSARSRTGLWSVYIYVFSDVFWSSNIVFDISNLHGAYYYGFYTIDGALWSWLCSWGMSSYEVQIGNPYTQCETMCHPLEHCSWYMSKLKYAPSPFCNLALCISSLEFPFLFLHSLFQYHIHT